jgi:mannose-6-phosphate isomerase-like protein (cupin superfamily)
MANRVLLSINEAQEARLPRTRSVDLSDWDGFYSEESHRCGARITHALERFAFGFLGSDMAGEAPVFPSIYDEAKTFWMRRRRALDRASYRAEGLALALIQHVPLYESVIASERNLPSEIRVLLANPALSATAKALTDALRRSGYRTGRHSYWQFYLPGSLAMVNYLLCLGRSPGTLFQYVGARLVLEVERAALGRALIDDIDAHYDSAETTMKAVHQRMLVLFVERFGPQASARIEAGAVSMRRLLSLVRRGVLEQLTWLSDLSWPQRAARQISERIERECPGIDRDTFVEPREMCSTTHVHDEHRLVVVETGHMRFWGNVGMCHDMYPGDMILIPKGCLHGSTVVSESCTYHQPIIPDDWRDVIPAWKEHA